MLDPAIVNRLLNRAREPGPLDELSPREREILSLMAEGHSNKRICELCFLSPKTVETHIHSILMKLGLGESPDSSRRVLAVLTYLRAWSDLDERVWLGWMERAGATPRSRLAERASLRVGRKSLACVHKSGSGT